MPSNFTRRQFITQASLASLGLAISSCSASKKTTAVPGLQLGYSAITWSGHDIDAIKDISALGFKGIQLRSNILREYGSKPAELRALLKQYNLYLPMFSSGNANINTGNDEAVIQQHVDNAKFVKAVGGSNIQVTNGSRPKTGAPSNEDLKKYGHLLTEIGKRTIDIGVQTNYHNHMGQLGQTPEEVDMILTNTEAGKVKFLLDIAHYKQGGGDPAKAVEMYNDRLHALHLKDVKPNPNGDAGAYTFVELGQGTVDIPAVMNALNKIRFKGWGVVELDSVPDKSKTPVECANITKAYLASLGFTI